MIAASPSFSMTANSSLIACCSVFLPKKPVTHPKLERVEKNEQMLDRERLIKEAAQGVEILNIKL